MSGRMAGTAGRGAGRKAVPVPEHSMIARPRAALAAAALCLVLSSVALAAPDAPAQGEIEHLLKFVAASNCTFVRNNIEYAADKASEHLAGKFRFAGSRIATAEDFIRELASRSSVSGEAYHVKCGSVDTPAGVWLTAELQRYRESRVRATR